MEYNIEITQMHFAIDTEKLSPNVSLSSLSAITKYFSFKIYYILETISNDSNSTIVLLFLVISTLNSL